MIAFETDVRLVVDWLEKHGESYLRRNPSIGESVEQARNLQKSHLSFLNVAMNTYDNVDKLRKVYIDVTRSGSSGFQLICVLTNNSF